MKTTLIRLWAIAMLGAGLAGCGAMNAQNPSGLLRPVNAVPDENASGVMLKGADVVAYFTQNQYVQGKPEFNSNYQGVVFRFSSAQHKALFDLDPMKYQPQYGGYCADGIVYGIPWGGDADTFRTVGGKVYIFGGAGSRDAFLLDEARNISLADKYWAQEIAGSNSFLQRSKRLVFRVAHYKSGEQLARDVADAKAQGKFPVP